MRRPRLKSSVVNFAKIVTRYKHHKFITAGRLRAALFKTKNKQEGTMFGFGHWELLIVLILVISILSLLKLPQIGAGISNRL